jgi:hypothetical protein
MRVKCINDSNKPSDIPNSKWVEKGIVYTVIDEYKSLPQEIDTYVLAELDLEGTGYGGFAADRFDIDLTDELEEINLEIMEEIDLETMNRSLKDEL